MQLPREFDFPFWWLVKLLFKTTVRQGCEKYGDTVYEWWEDQLFSEAERLRQVIDLWDTADKTQYFVKTKCKPVIILGNKSVIIW